MQPVIAHVVKAKVTSLRSKQTTHYKDELWTQAKLAEQLGIDASTLSLKLSGKREFSISEAQKLAEFLGIDLNAIGVLIELSKVA